MEKLLFYPELVLRVVELSDVKDVAVLLEIPEFEEYIHEYKTSIIKEKQRAFLLPAGWAGTEAVIRHHPKDILKNPGRYTSNTEIGFIDDWGAVEIMKERDLEINSLLYTSSYLRLCPDIKPGARITWPLLDDAVVPKLRRILRRALYICDAVYDIEAQTLVSLGWPVPAYHFKPTCPFPLTEMQASEWFHCLESHASGELQRLLCLWRIPKLTRQSQFKFIQTLCNADLLALWTLCYLASESFHEWRATAHQGDMHEAIGRERAFKHCILSYGSYFLYGHVRSNGARSRHNGSLLNPVIREFTTDDPLEANRLPPGALAALNNTLMNRLDVNIRDVDDKVLELLVEVLGVEKKAFDNPPSTIVLEA